MSIFRKTAIHRTTDNQWIVLPPYDLKCSVTPIVDIQSETLPLGSIIVHRRQQVGWTIQVSGKFRSRSLTDGMSFKEALKSFCNAADGDSSFLTVTEFVDTGAVYKGFYRSCFCSKDPIFSSTGKGLREFKYSFELISKDIATYSSAPDSTQPPVSSYDTMFCDTTTGTGQGTGQGTGTTIIFASTSYQRSFTLPDLVDAATDANNVNNRQIEWTINSTAAYTLESVQITNVGNLTGTTGNTVLVFSDGDYTQYATANKVTLTLPYNSHSTGINSCNLNIPAGQKLYVYVYSAAGHQDIQISCGVRL